MISCDFMNTKDRHHIDFIGEIYTWNVQMLIRMRKFQL